jgi:hypothetical protein
MVGRDSLHTALYSKRIFAALGCVVDSYSVVVGDEGGSCLADVVPRFSPGSSCHRHSFRRQA